MLGERVAGGEVFLARLHRDMRGMRMRGEPLAEAHRLLVADVDLERQVDFFPGLRTPREDDGLSRCAPDGLRGSAPD